MTLTDLKTYSRFAWRLRNFLRHPVTLGEAAAITRQRMAEREKNFLCLVERGIFGNAKSPYLSLFELAGCQFGDVSNMVRRKGLEKTLSTLKASGVYIKFEEFKGRAPIVRSGRVIPVRDRDFDNPYLSHYYHAQSGGTTGAGTRVTIDLDHLAARASSYLLAYDAHGVLRIPTVIWRGSLPDPSGTANILLNAHLGLVPRKWFTPISAQDVTCTLKDRLGTIYIIVMGRLCGVPIPWPEPVSLDRAELIASWLANTVRREGACLVRTPVSMALRVSLAARERGDDLRGVTFWGAGEPVTHVKVREITAAGARYVPTYAFAEAGPVALGCAATTCNDSLHFLRDSFALLQDPLKTALLPDVARAFFFTTLSATAPKIMLNVESGDCGVVEEQSCDCPMQTHGYIERLSRIASYRKVTSEGASLLASEMLPVLEEVLPARFGGTPLDYQMLEEEDEEGFSRLTLIVSPRIRINSESDVIDAVMGFLKQGDLSAELASVLWRQGKTFRIKRMEPIVSGSGKLKPLFFGQQSYKTTH